MLRARLLGYPTFTSSAGDLRLPPRVRLLAAYLCYNKGEHVPRRRLAGLLWPEADEGHASASLRTALHTLRSALGEVGEDDILEIGRETARVRDSSSCDVDVHRFEAIVRTALAPSARGDMSDLVGAIALYKGELLAGMDGDLAELEDWCLPRRAGLQDLYVSALSAAVGYFTETGLHHAALDHAVRWRDADPLSEEASRALMRLYAETGQPARVAAEFERCRDTLEEELGVLPSDETVETWRRKSRAAARKTLKVLELRNAPSPDELSTDPLRNAGLLLIFGEQKVMQGEVEKGMEALERARAVYEKMGEAELEAGARLTIAGALLNSPVSPRPDLAVEKVMPLLAQYREHGPAGDLGRALLIAADALQMCSAYEESAALAREGLGLARSMGNRDLETRLNLVRGLALTYSQELPEATEALEAAIAGLGRLYRPREMLRAMAGRGTLAVLNETLPDAIQYLVEAISIATKLPRTPLTVWTEGFARGMLVILYWGLDRHAEARALALDSGFDLGSAPGGNVLKAICLPGEDRVTSANTAARILRESLSSLPSWPAVGFTRILWQQMMLLEMHDEALPWSAVNIRLSRRVRMKLYEGTGYSARGITLARLGRLPAAEVCLERARALLDPEHGYSMAYLAHLQGLIAWDKGDGAGARRALQDSFDVWERIGDIQFTRMIKADMARLAEAGAPAPIAAKTAPECEAPMPTPSA